MGLLLWAAQAVVPHLSTANVVDGEGSQVPYLYKAVSTPGPSSACSSHNKGADQTAYTMHEMLHDKRIGDV